MQSPEISPDTLMGLLTGKINPFDVVKSISDRPRTTVHAREDSRPEYIQRRDDYSIGEH